MNRYETEQYPNNSILSQRRLKALSALENTLHSTSESFLREHQISMLDSLRTHLSNGETSGYITAPPGIGKTMVFVELARATGLKTVVASPTQLLLRQTSDRFGQFAPDGRKRQKSIKKEEKDGGNHMLSQIQYQPILKMRS